MEWSKIKNIILVILLMVNLILLGVVGYQEYRSAQYDAQTLELAVKLLADNGITVAADLPEWGSLSTLQLENLPWDSTAMQAQATAVLGELEWVDDRGGTRIVCQGERGSGELSSDGHFAFMLDDGTLPAASDRKSQGKELLEQLGIQVVLAEETRQDELEQTVYWQIWNGTPIFTCKSIMTCREGSVVSLSGQRLLGRAAVVNSQSLLTIPTVLVRFLNGMNQNGYVCSMVTKMSLGYSTTISTNRLTPVWALDTDTGRYYVNAITGAFSRAEKS